MYLENSCTFGPKIFIFTKFHVRVFSKVFEHMELQLWTLLRHFIFLYGWCGSAIMAPFHQFAMYQSH
jgi:hypothetical protein